MFIMLVCCIGGSFSNAAAATEVSFSWRANPAEDNVVGYRLYYGHGSRFTTSGTPKPDFSYSSYLDFTESERCELTDSGPVCEPYSKEEVKCVGLNGAAPKCTMYNLKGTYYFAMTAYNTTAESDYTPELKGYFSNTVSPQASHVASTLQRAYYLLLKEKK